jgi:hypothetical protein
MRGGAVSEASTPRGSKVTGPIWPDALLRTIHERDRARDVAVALEQENAALRSLRLPDTVVTDTSGLLDYHETEYAVWSDVSTVWSDVSLTACCPGVYSMESVTCPGCGKPLDRTPEPP